MNAATKPPSERQLLCERIAEFLRTNDLCTPYGGDVSLFKGQGRPRYTVAFSKPRILDGTVEVYSPTYVLVRWITAVRALPHADGYVFESEQTAQDFLRLAFVEHDFDAALALPRKSK